MPIPELDGVELLALGEPTHGEAGFLRARNELLAALVERGFRSIALETDRIRALAVDDHVRGPDVSLDVSTGEVVAVGFSHGFGALPANRDLVEWLRDHNAARPDDEQVSFHGFDAPMETTSAPSPAAYLSHLHGYLIDHLGPDGFRHGRADLAALAGAELRWSDPAAVLDPAASVGATPGANALRAIADDLLTTLYAAVPRLVAASSVAAWRRAEAHGRAALGLLRYHAQAAEPLPQAERLARLLGVRDALMAENLLDVRAAERDRGPTLVFAHNLHLQRRPSTMRMAGRDLTWAGAGSIVATLLGARFRVVTGSLGAATVTPLAAPAPDTFEGALGAAFPAGGFVDRHQLDDVLSSGRLRARSDVTPGQGYFPLDEETLRSCDAVYHVPSGAPAEPFGPAALAERIAALPGAEVQQADEASGAPRLSWGDYFCFIGDERMHPFATIVGNDVPGFDEASRLDRPGAHRLNLHVGLAEFRRLFGFSPEGLEELRASIDFARADLVLPHPAYAAQGWVSVVNPGPASQPEVDRLIALAHERALDRRARREASGREASRREGPAGRGNPGDSAGPPR
jgi:erythromycin esterase-like protein